MVGMVVMLVKGNHRGHQICPKGHLLKVVRADLLLSNQRCIALGVFCEALGTDRVNNLMQLC